MDRQGDRSDFGTSCDSFGGVSGGTLEHGRMPAATIEDVHPSPHHGPGLEKKNNNQVPNKAVKQPFRQKDRLNLGRSNNAPQTKRL